MTTNRPSDNIATKARLAARPKSAERKREPGQLALGLTPQRDALLYIPEQYSSDRPTPLVVSLHGAGGNQNHGLDLLRSEADKHGFVLLSPASRRGTWDVIESGFGPDVSLLDKALERTFELCSIDAKRLAIGGFSDGASYALTLGLANGDLFSHILAFSPGFTAHPSATGKPEIFISHGIRDQVLPIDRCSRRLVPRLKAAGYRVDYREFDGPHTVPAEMSSAAIRQLVGTPMNV
ncbi:MAG TPA: phospholipase [Bryobacteraceae bacterium]|nr:phospholipase [Bryobacteraceae bacterium]